MDLKSAECRKSLDQLLEQAMAERSREDDQVEVTYEMREDCCDQRPMRLKPDDRNSTSSRNEKDDVEEENEGTVGSVQMEKQVMKSTIILSVAMIFCFSGFSVVQSFISTSISDTGQHVLGILYICATLSVFFAPIIVQKLGPKWTMAATALTPVTFIIAFHFAVNFLLVISAIIVGFSFGPSCRAQKTFLFRSISRLSFVTQAIRRKIQQRFLRIFFVISKSFYFWGHLIASLVMEYTHVAKNLKQFSNETNENTGTVVRKMNACSSNQCKNVFMSNELSLSGQTQTKSYDLMSPNVTELFLYIFVGVSLAGILLLAVFLEKLEVLQEQDPLERPLFFQTLRQIKLLILDQNVSLMLLMIIFTGIEQAFLFGDFTKDYISCALSLESIAFTIICFCGCNTLGTIGVHSFSQHFQRPIIMAAGLVCQSGLLMVLWLWTPVKDDAAVFYVIAGGWGLCNAIWETLMLTYLTTAYPDDWQTPVCVYYQLQWLGMGITFLLNYWLCSHVKILILATFLAISVIPYTILEFRLHHRNHLQNRTDML